MLKFLLAEPASKGNWVLIAILLVAMVFILVMPFFTQRKKNKQYNEMLNSIRVGDLVKTVGGVIGKVTKIIDKGEIKTVILETGSKSEKSFLEFDITHIYCVLKSSKAPDEEETAAVEAPKASETEEQKTKEQQAEVKSEEVAESKAVEAEASENKKEAKPAKKQPQKKQTASRKKTTETKK